MKRLYLLPRLNKICIAAILLSGMILFADSCAPKPGCGNKCDHRRRKKSVKRFAPGMSYMFVKPTEERYSFFA